jgi:phenylacetate-CoA ligase
VPKDIKSKTDLHKIPILTKKIIKSEGTKRFTSTKYYKKKVVQRTSSGYVGVPLSYIINKEAYSMDLAANLRGWYSMGYRLGDKFMKLSLNTRKAKIKQLQDFLSRNFYLHIPSYTDLRLIEVLQDIEEYKPKVIRCYPDPLLYLARSKKKNLKFTYNPKSINTTGNILFPEVRKEIEEAFNCKIFDSYSCEGNSNVFECPTHTCYHSTEEYGISEVLNENSENITKGIGKLISTDLWNLAHPFIRYDTHDLIEVDDSICSCGRQHLKINRIIGRDNDFISIPSGRHFVVYDFTIFFSTNANLNKAIDEFQVINKGDEVLILLIVNDNFNENVSKFIKTYWEEQFQVPVSIKIVEFIPLTSIGKRIYFKNELNQ